MVAVVLGFVLGPDRAHRLHALVHDRPARRWVDAVVGDLLGDPADTDAEQHASVREDVEAGNCLGRGDRLAFGGEADAGSQPQRLRRGGGARNGDKGVVVVGEVRLHSTLRLLHQRARLRRRWDVGVVGEEQRFEAALLDGPGQLVGSDREVRGEDGDPKLHAVTATSS
jgi:hypothetical protein